MPHTLWPAQFTFPEKRRRDPEENTTKHVEAPEYHTMMAEPNTVIIDVRNHYEAQIGPMLGQLECWALLLVN